MRETVDPKATCWLTNAVFKVRSTIAHRPTSRHLMCCVVYISHPRIQHCCDMKGRVFRVFPVALFLFSHSPPYCSSHLRLRRTVWAFVPAHWCSCDAKSSPGPGQSVLYCCVLRGARTCSPNHHLRRATQGVEVPLTARAEFKDGSASEIFTHPVYCYHTKNIWATGSH